MIAPAAMAEPIQMRAGAVTYVVDPASLNIDAQAGGTSALNIMPPVHAPTNAVVIADGPGWRWSDAEGHSFRLSIEGTALRLRISGQNGTTLSWRLPKAIEGTWLVPDGEGMAYKVDDPFWRSEFRHRHAQCLGGTTLLSFPAWTYLGGKTAISYGLGDGFLSSLCLRDDDGLQATLVHDFADGAGTLDLLFDIGPPNPLAPALFYRQILKQRGQLKTFADKSVPNLPRLFGAPHAYVWGDGRNVRFLDDLKALGIKRLVLSYDQDPHQDKHLVGSHYLRRAYALGYLAGPYDAFENGQPAKTADSPAAVWGDDLYPSACLIDAKGKVVSGFANRGCEMSSEAIARHEPFVPAARYAKHIADGASHVFIDVDAFGVFYDDFSTDHPMTMSRDRDHRLRRLGLGISQFHLVLGSENVTAWSAGVAHYSHGTAQAHVSAVWPIQSDKRFGGYWPPERQAIYFAPFQPTANEARTLFGPMDRLPLFEAVFHDSVVAMDRWEFGMMKVAGMERNRFARSLLYGTPTMWNLDRRELKRVGPWLKAAHDDFLTIHGAATPVALTGFEWLAPDRSVQQVSYADGRTVIANFGESAWQGLPPDCVRFREPNRPSLDFCPPPTPAPFKQ